MLRRLPFWWQWPYKKHAFIYWDIHLFQKPPVGDMQSQTQSDWRHLTSNMNMFQTYKLKHKYVLVTWSCIYAHLVCAFAFIVWAPFINMADQVSGFIVLHVQRQISWNLVRWLTLIFFFTTSRGSLEPQHIKKWRSSDMGWNWSISPKRP